MLDTYFINKTCTGVANTQFDSYNITFTNLVREIISKIEQFLPDSFTYCGTPMEERTFVVVSNYNRYYFKYAIDGVPDMYYYIEIYVTSKNYFGSNDGFCDIFTFMSQEDLSNIEGSNEACNTCLLTMSDQVKCSFSATTNRYYDSDGVEHWRTRASLSFNMGVIQNDNTVLVYFSNGDIIKNKDLHAGYTTINGEKYLMLYKARWDNGMYILYYSKDGDIYYSRGITYDLEGFDDPTKILALPVFLSTSNADRAQIDPSLSPDGILECPDKSCSIGSKYIIDGKLYFALNNNILIED